MRKLTVSLAATVLIAAGLAGRAAAQVKTVVDLDFSKADAQGMIQLSGSAVFADGRLRLIDGNGSESASAFLKTPIQVSDYLATFDFEVKSNPDNSNPPADGFTFLAQTAGADRIGGGGGGIGLTRTDNNGLPDASNPQGGGFPGYSYGIEFNSWNGQGIPGMPETIALDLNGQRSKIGITPFKHVDAGMLHAETRVTPAQLVMTITKKGDTKPVMTFTSPTWLVNFFNPPKPLFFGFTGATGGAVETVDIVNFKIQTGLPAPSPPAGTAPAPTAGQ